MNSPIHKIAADKRGTKRNAAARAMLWLSLLAMGLSILYLMLGDSFIGIHRVWQGLWGRGLEEDVLIVQSFRAPRLAIALLVGAALAISGAILQAVIRNPLAAPDVVGITGGASLGAVLFLTVLAGTFGRELLPLAAIIGAFCASALIYMLAWRKGADSLRLVLVGIGVASLLSAGTSFLLTFSPAYSATSAYIWLTGTIYGSSWEDAAILAPWMLVFCIILYFNTGNLHAQLLGDELAIGIGSPLQRHRLLLVSLSVALAGAAVAIGGSIGFVGLIAPHMARRLVGPVIRRVLPVSALIGAIVVAAADLIGRTVFLPYDIPVGVFTSAVGAPFFIYLLYRSRKTG
ncbi:iron ABC transporter permease [Paenibacillus sp. 1011MAR3C5]|uniref:FecCD family ABC transporter permease n=1 Tax=Paenibacillus sp. 1011MAR3C5 TaxID=1675787 RepID=UPI000E6CC5FC|nr:iron ABC transporter permease [Paenibacillus sp. 1011MAR3C5]RJE88953.1 iron ABC transporter permease [Paenibacillus sp. 1011MAR3C5]